MLSFEENLCLLEEEEMKGRTKYIEIEQSNLYLNMSNIVATIEKIIDILMSNDMILEKDYLEIKSLQEKCLRNVGNMLDKILKYEKIRFN